MTRPLLTTSRLAVAAGLCLAVALAALWYVGRGGADVVAESSGWKTIEHEQVRVEIPESWERLDQGDCEFELEVWAPPGTAPCSWSGGVAFYGSATFDPAHRPGIWRDDDTPGRVTPMPVSFAVYVGDDDRADRAPRAGLGGLTAARGRQSQGRGNHREGSYRRSGSPGSMAYHPSSGPGGCSARRRAQARSCRTRSVPARAPCEQISHRSIRSGGAPFRFGCG